MESSASSVDHTDERGHKQLESPENSEDRISALPDSLIHHILSFLPSTKQAIRTSILSKRWLNQWTRVPVLIFEIDREYAAFFLQFISSTLLLYDRFSKIKKFQISYDFERDINFASKLRFATRRDVEELILNCNHTYCYDPYLLPKFLFENASSLIKLQISNCLFQLSWKINWPSLKSLRMDGFTLRNGQSIPNVLSGSPSLESLEVYNVFCENSFVIASKSLKRLILTNLMIRQVVDIEISCPILEKLCVKVRELGEHSIITAKTLQHVLSTSPLLHSLVLKDCCYHHLVIASKSLKRLVLYDCRSFIISCPNLEVLNMCGTKIEACKLIFNTPSCLIPFGGPGINLSTKILEVLKPVKKLKVHNWIVKILPALEMGGQSYPWLNIKYWTLDCPNFKHISGILNVLRCSPVLERLVINLHPYKYRKIAGPKLNHFKETYQIANGTEFPCLVSHLKFVKIIGLSKKDGKRKAILYFVKFLLKNARALEKIVVMLKDGGMNKVSQNVLSFPSCSQNVIIEILPALEMGELSCPLLNIKCLTLDCPNFKHISGILNVLRCSPVLERLVVKLHDSKYRKTAELDLNTFEETYRNLNGTVFPCLVSHLKFVKVIGLSNKDGKRMIIIRFLQFLLKNARALKKMDMILIDGRMNKVSRKVCKPSKGFFLMPL